MLCVSPLLDSYCMCYNPSVDVSRLWKCCLWVERNEGCSRVQCWSIIVFLAMEESFQCAYILAEFSEWVQQLRILVWPYLLTGTKSLARLWRECNMTIRLSKFLSSLSIFSGLWLFWMISILSSFPGLCLSLAWATYIVIIRILSGSWWLDKVRSIFGTTIFAHFQGVGGCFAGDSSVRESNNRLWSRN